MIYALSRKECFSKYIDPWPFVRRQKLTEDVAYVRPEREIAVTQHVNCEMNSTKVVKGKGGKPAEL